jgi:hypothetical protein
MALFVVNPSASNAHNVDIHVKEINPRDLGNGQANMQRDLEMFHMQSATLPIVNAFGTGRYSNTGLNYQFIPPTQIFEITMEPEDGDAVDEQLWFSARTECIFSAIRIRDGKILLENVSPPFSMLTGQYNQKGLSHCSVAN